MSSDLEDFAMVGKKGGKKDKSSSTSKRKREEEDEEESKRTTKVNKSKTAQESKAAPAPSASSAAPAAAAPAENKDVILAPVINTGLTTYIENAKKLKGNWMVNKPKYYWQAVLQTMGTLKGKYKMVLQSRDDRKPNEFGTTILTHPVQVFGKWMGLTGDWKNPSEKNAQNQDALHPIKAKRRLMISRDDGTNGVTAEFIDWLRDLLHEGIKQGLKEGKVNFLTQKRQEQEGAWKMANEGKPEDKEAKEKFIFKQIMANCVHAMTYIPTEKKEENGREPVLIEHPEREMVTFKSKVCRQLFNDAKKPATAVAKPDLAYSSNEIVIKLNEHNKTAAVDKRFEFIQHKILNLRKHTYEPFERAVVNSGDVIAMYFTVDLAVWKDPTTEVERIGLRCRYKNDCMLFERGKLQTLSTENAEAAKKIDFGFAPEEGDADGDAQMKEKNNNVRVFLADVPDGGDGHDGDD